MTTFSRRKFLLSASAALAVATSPSFAAEIPAPSSRKRVFVGSNTANGILAFDWDPATGELTSAGVAAKATNVDWIVYSRDRKSLFAASEIESFQGKRTGAVLSFRVENGALTPLSQQNSASYGTCYIGLDQSGKVLISADYAGGAAASFLVTAGKLSPAVWTEHYTGHGPVANRQQSAHAHFVSFSPDNRFAYINDLGSDCIHIYSLDESTAKLTPAGTYNAKPGSGPRTLHFHPNGHTAYGMNELNSTVDVVEWNRADGGLTFVTRIELLPAGGATNVVNTGCDTVIGKDGRHVYFANRGNDFLYAFNADVKTGALTPIGRTNCGGRTPRNFVLDPTERWMLVANQNSSLISVFARNPETGVLANEGKSYAAASPMCILF